MVGAQTLSTIELCSQALAQRHCVAVASYHLQMCIWGSDTNDAVPRRLLETNRKMRLFELSESSADGCYISVGVKETQSWCRNTAN